MKILEKRFHYVRISAGKTEVCRFIELKSAKEEEKRKKQINCNPHMFYEFSFGLFKNLNLMKRRTIEIPMTASKKTTTQV